MTRAKREGRNTVRAFSVEQMQELEDRLVLGARLREAIARDELSLHYQPQLSAADLRITGFEALVRWTSPDLGPVPPGRFIPIAESLGLMPEVGLWVCTPGTWRLSIPRDELCHFLSGRAIYRRDNGEVIEIRPHTLVLFPAGWTGECHVQQTLRNVYMLAQD